MECVTMTIDREKLILRVDDTGGKRTQGVNRGGRYRVTNSTTPETYPFIVGHWVRGRTRESAKAPPSFSIMSQ